MDRRGTALSERRGRSEATDEQVGPRRVARALLVVPLAFLAVFFAYPVASMLARGFEGSGGTRLGDLLGSASFWRIAWFTLWQAVLSTLLTLAVGLPATWAARRLGPRVVSATRALLVVPFVLPTIVMGLAVDALSERLGLDRGPLRLRHTVGAILLAHVIFNVAVVVRLVGAYWVGVDDRAEEAARTLGASRVRAFVEVTLPQLRPAITAAAAIVFLFCFTSFGVILTVGGTAHATIETEIWRYATRRTDFTTAAALAVLQLVAVVAIVAWSTYVERRAGGSAARHRVAGGGARRSGEGRVRAVAWSVLAATLVLEALPLVALGERSLRVGDGYGLANYRALASDDRALLVTPLSTMRTSLAYATTATSLAVLVGALASGAAVYGGRLLGRAVDIGFMVPLGTSAVTLGFGMLLALDTPPLDLRTSWWIVPIAQALIGVPFVMRSMVPALRSIDQRQRDAAAVLGAAPRAVWREIDLVVARRAVASAAALAFAVSLGEFGATTFLARPAKPTMTVAMFRLLGLPGATRRGEAMALGVVLSALVAVVAWLIERTRPRDVVGL